eukprot:1365579-Amorphochlora_amoeboformis.AAC.1
MSGARQEPIEIPLSEEETEIYAEYKNATNKTERDAAQVAFLRSNQFVRVKDPVVKVRFQVVERFRPLRNVRWY